MGIKTQQCQVTVGDIEDIQVVVDIITIDKEQLALVVFITQPDQIS